MDEKQDVNLVISPVGSFSWALIMLMLGERLARDGWNGKDMFVVRQKAYPQGIPCNKQTAEAYNVEEGTLMKFAPYLQLKNCNDTCYMWIPSQGDLFADDWYIVD